MPSTVGAHALVAPTIGSSSQDQEGEAKGEEEEPRQIRVLTSPVQGPLTRRPVRKTVGP
jgi:hypothetical protein